MEDGRLTEEKSRVFNVEYGFNNERMERLLMKRGRAMRNASHSGQRRCEAKLQKYKDEKLEDIRTANTFYVTFEHVEACQVMLSLETLQLGSEDVKLKPAKDPTDIIW